MCDTTIGPPEDDERLEAVIAEYLKSGGKLTREAVLAAHPEFAPQLTAFFAAEDKFGTLRPTTKLGDFELFEELGRGGMGVVYRAKQLSLDRTVAVKMILPGQLASDEDIARFRREAQSAAELDHPGIVTVYQTGEYEGRHFFAMKYVEGRNLADVVRDDPLPAMQAADFVRKIAKAIQYAHDKGTLHRDLKPANVIVDAENEPWITDFGLAKKLVGADEFTATGQVVGTPSYMPPEQATDDRSRIGPASDIYSTGAVLYRLIAGRAPFTSESVLTTLRQVINDEPVLPRRLNPKIPRDLETICLKCLEKEPTKRYETARQLADDLQRFLNGEAILARQKWHKVDRSLKWANRHRAVVAVLVLTVLVVVGLPTFLWVNANVRREKAHADTVAALAARDLLSAVKLQEFRTFHARVSSVESVLARREIGWKPKVRQDLYAAARQVADRKVDVGRPLKLRELLAFSSSGLDVSPKSQVILGNVGPSCFTFSQDGRVLAIADSRTNLESTVWLLDAKTGGVIKTLTYGPLAESPWSRGGRGTSAVALAPTGCWLSVGTLSGYIHCWDLSHDSAQRRSVPRSHDESIRCLCLAPDGKTCYSAADDHVVKVWAVPEWKELRAIAKSGKLGGSRVANSPDGRLLAICTGIAGLRFLDTEKLEEQSRGGSFELLEGCAGAVCFSPDGRTVASFAEGKIVLVDAAELRVFRTLTDERIGAAHTGADPDLQFSPDNSLLVSSSADGTAKIWEVTSARLLLTVVVDELARTVRSGFSPDGKSIVAIGNGTVSRYDIVQPTTQSIIAHHPYPPRAAEFSPDGTQIACITDSEVTIWSVEQGMLVAAYRHPKRLTNRSGDVAFHPQSKILAFATADGISLWDFSGNKIDARIAIEQKDGIADIRFSQDGATTLWIAVDDRIKAWKIPDAKLSDPWKNWADSPKSRKGIRGVGVGKQWMAAATPDGVELLRVGREQGQIVQQVPEVPIPGAVLCTALSADESLAAVGTRAGRVYVVDVAERKRLCELSGGTGAHDDRVESVDFSADGQYLATGSRDGNVRLWKASDRSFELLITLPSPGGAIQSVRFSPDGRRLATLVRGENAVRMWLLDRLWSELKEAQLQW